MLSTILLFLLAANPAPRSAAPPARPFSARDMVAVQCISDPQPSPDGRLVVFAVSDGEDAGTLKVSASALEPTAIELPVKARRGQNVVELSGNRPAAYQLLTSYVLPWRHFCPFSTVGFWSRSRASWAERAVVPYSLQFEELVVDLVAELPEVGEVLDALLHLEVPRVLMVVSVRNARFSLKYYFTWERLCSTWRLGLTPLVMTRVRYPWGGGGVCRVVPRREEEAHSVGPTQVEVVSDDLLEEVPALDWTVEDLGEADLYLPEREPVPEARLDVPRCQRPRQLRRPWLEEALHVGWPERIARLLEPLRVSA